MALWQKLWLLFAVIWVVVAGLNAFTILVASEEPERAVAPLFFAVAVPAALYLVLWGWNWFRKK